ncbi:MAG TPA: hypothetical protein VKV26_01155 [Dehalococcoidia bacterium]|nr:hypothetical protein [Dehalococcoidia bacterium]
MSSVHSTATRTLPAPRRSLWSRLKLPAILLLIAINAGAIVGNAALDLWQVLGPSRVVSGTLVGHERIVQTGENADEQYVLTVDTGHGNELINATEKAFNETQTGQSVTVEWDGRGALGHDEALRKLTAGAQVVYQSHPWRRALSQLIVAGITIAVAAVATLWLLRGTARRRPSPTRASD